MKTRSNTLVREADDEAPRGAVLVLLLECERPAASSARHELRGLAQVAIGRAAAAARTVARGRRALQLGVPDARMSERHARLALELDRWVVEDAGAKNGVLVNGERVQRAVLEDGDVIELGRTLFLWCADVAPGAFPPDFDAAAAPAVAGLATLAPALARQLADLARVAKTAAPLLVHGETGTGKELIARAAHTLGGRAGAFVAVNCGALPPTLVESELFGVKRGAFSGATEDRAGFVRSADGGTLFLDEIADLPLASQAALLRVLQEREVTPLGASRAVPVDLALVAATHRDLAALVAREQFRRDLYARLAGFVVTLPPLRARREDLGIVIAALLARHPDRAGVRFATDAARALVAYDWPNNVRELEACLVVAGALATDGAIRIEQLPEAVRTAKRAGAAGVVALASEPGTRRDQLAALLREHRGNISAIARATNRSRIQVHRWLEQVGLDPSDYR